MLSTDSQFALGATAARAISLADGVVKSMIGTNLKIAAAVLLTLCAVGTGAGVFWHQAGPASSPPADKTASNSNSVAASPTPQASTSKQAKELQPAPLAKPVWENRLIEIRAKLDQPVTLEFQPGQIGDALDFITDRYNIPITIERKAFNVQLDLDEFLQQRVQTPKFFGTKLRTVLRSLLCQAGADFQLRDGGLIILPKDYAASGQLLQQPLDAAFRQVPLEKALEELAARTGICITLDARTMRNAQLPITASFDNVPLETLCAC
jgi:hypothetical protein